jgi:hypothetical protein
LAAFPPFLSGFRLDGHKKSSLAGRPQKQRKIHPNFLRPLSVGQQMADGPIRVEQEMKRLVSPGKKSKVANKPLRRQQELIRRQSAADALLSGSARGRKLSTAAIITGLYRDREDR